MPATTWHYRTLYQAVQQPRRKTVLPRLQGIGTEAYTALKLKRKAIGIELKPGYSPADSQPAGD
ncbi:MAG: hypothetical protein IPM07_30445 [Anaerolineales bacterium]|nr:hypothetical protein [Anaerolineales bacterium]